MVVYFVVSAPFPSALSFFLGFLNGIALGFIVKPNFDRLLDKLLDRCARY
jgi:hypothetical protein